MGFCFIFLELEGRQLDNIILINIMGKKPISFCFFEPGIKFRPLQDLVFDIIIIIDDVLITINRHNLVLFLGMYHFSF